MFSINTKGLVVLLTILLLVCSCGEPTAKEPSTTDTEIITNAPTPVNSSAAESAANQYLIKGNGFYGLLSGVPFEDRMERLEKGSLSDGEGDFEVYYIKGVEGEQVGYVLPHTQDASLIGSITITTPKAKTADGIGIGSTYGDLKAQTSDIVVHGSEIESRTHAMRGREMFLLDAYENTYEVDESTIAPNTKIKQITILQHQAG